MCFFQVYEIWGGGKKKKKISCEGVDVYADKALKRTTEQSTMETKILFSTAEWQQTTADGFLSACLCLTDTLQKKKMIEANLT